MGESKDGVATKSSSGRNRAIGTKSSGRLAKIAEDVTPALKERILGALWMLTKGARSSVPVAAVRSHLEDVTPAELERAICALVLDGRLDLAETGDATLIKLRPVQRRPLQAANALVADMRTRIMKLASKLPEVRLPKSFLSRKKSAS